MNQAMRKGHTFKNEYFLLGLLIATVSLINLIWIKQDIRPQPFIDPYPQNTLAFIDGLNEQGLTQLPWLVVKMKVGPRPPLYQLLTVPSIYLFGRSVDAMLIVNTVFGIILLLAVYGIGTLVKDSKAGLLAALLVATYPPIVNLSKIARPHSVAPACVALSLWLLLLLVKTRSRKVAWLFGASLGFGFLIHPNLLYLLPIPSIIFGLYMVFFQTEPKRPQHLKQIPRWLLTKLGDQFVLYGLLPAAGIAIGVTAVWYLPLIHSVIGLVRDSAAFWAGRSHGFPDVPPTFWWYALTMPGAISSVLTLLFGVSLVVNIIKRQPDVAALSITFLLIYIGFSLRKGTMAWMNFAAVLPIIAVITAVFITEISDPDSPTHTISQADESRVTLPSQRRPFTKCIYRWLSIAPLFVCIIAAIFIFSVVTWGIPPHSKSVVRALGAPLDSTCAWRMTVAFCPNPPRDENWQISEILQNIVNDPDCTKRECALAIVTESAENFHHSAFSYYLIRDFPRFKMKIEFTSPFRGPAELHWLTYDYVVYIPQLKTNLYSNAVVSFLGTPPQVFSETHQEIASFSLPQEWTARLIKRTKPLTHKEAEISIEMLDIPEDLRTQLLDKAQTLFIKRLGRAH